MKLKNLKQTVEFKGATPHDVYELIMDSKKHSAVTGDTAKLSRKVGAGFSAFSGWATGKNLELVPDKKIVQSWRGGDWPKGHFSQATFAFAKSKTGTKLTFTQTGIPEDQYEDIKHGWIDNYWEPMKRFLTNQK